MSIALRSATAADTTTLLEIQREASLAAFAHIFPPGRYPFPSEQILRAWEELLAEPDVRVLIAERNGHPVGIAAYAPGRFDQLWVVPSEWGSGLSQVVYEEVLKGLRELRSGVCRLWVLAENHRARRFYERRGWRPDGRRMRTPYPPNPERVGYSLETSEHYRELRP
jgi:RimJ/RimL family protein N-acetyltransferase